MPKKDNSITAETVNSLAWQKENASDPDNLYKKDKYDPDGFWDGESLDDDSYHPTYRPKV